MWRLFWRCLLFFFSSFGTSGSLWILIMIFQGNFTYTVEPRYLELAYFELPLISKWKSGPCLNMKLWQQVTKQCGKEENFSSFPYYFIYIYLTSGVKLHIHLLNVVIQFIVFLTLSTLICRCTNISKYFSESLGIRDNESRLYFSNPLRWCKKYSFYPKNYKAISFLSLPELNKF